MRNRASRFAVPRSLAVSVMLVLTCALAALTVAACGSSSASPSGSATALGQPFGIAGNWKLVLNSTFNATPLDTALWRRGWFGSRVSGPINQHEAACYSSRHVLIAGGALNLELTRTSSSCEHVRRPFTGAIVSTNPEDGRRSHGFSYRYGVLQVRVKTDTVGKVVADWPTVLTLGQVWPKDGEDDLLEGLGGIACFHFHSPGYAPGGNLGGCLPQLAAGWHTVASDWEPGSTTWYVDGREVGRATKGITSAPMYIVLANTLSRLSPQTWKPDTMQVSYVRVWQRRAGEAVRATKSKSK